MRSSYTYAIVSPTSLGYRIAPTEYRQVFTSDTFFLQATSAESNTLSVPAALGLKVKALSKFAEGDPMARFIRRDMRSRGIEVSDVEVPQDGPWGVRHPCNIAENGFGSRGPRVVNDRAGELSRTVCAEDFCPEKLFGEEGVAILHLSGLFCALSAESARCGLELAKCAKKHGTLVSFDTNYRPSLWKGREAELLPIFDEIASCSDILFGGDILIEKKLGEPPFFGLEFPDTKSRLSGAEILLRKAREGYPDVETFVSTVREVVTVNRHAFGAVSLSHGIITTFDPHTMPVYDRIGGGDAFVGGYLYGTLMGWPEKKRLAFGCGCAAFVSGLADDYGLPASEEQIFDLQRDDAWTSR